MQCKRCDGEVTWRGPFSALTHTECSSCGGINCQRVTPRDEPDDSDMNQVHEGSVECGNTPYDEGPFTLATLPDNAM
jgi:hypothetical protein